MSSSEVRIPDFSELPLHRGDPPHSAWGLYGDNDQLGTLNRLTGEMVAKAAQLEIQSGKRLSLNLPLDAMGSRPYFGRQAFHKEIYQKKPRAVNDDRWTFNTQSSRDGLRHFAYQDAQLFYNGVTISDIHDSASSTVNGIHTWAEKGIVGRGVLLDFDRWRRANKLSYDPFERDTISLEQLKATAEYQGTEIQFGDILIVRTGFLAAFNTKSASEIEASAKVVPPNLSGVAQSKDTLRWIWENFSAVAGDQPSFECWPSQTNWYMHEVLLAGFGCPIGELFDLEELARHCESIGRWSFFVSSEVCNVTGGVASPPNILAIF